MHETELNWLLKCATDISALADQATLGDRRTLALPQSRTSLTSDVNMIVSACKLQGNGEVVKSILSREVKTSAPRLTS
jgi:hypothetical protein